MDADLGGAEGHPRPGAVGAELGGVGGGDGEQLRRAAAVAGAGRCVGGAQQQHAAGGQLFRGGGGAVWELVGGVEGDLLRDVVAVGSPQQDGDVAGGGGDDQRVAADAGKAQRPVGGHPVQPGRLGVDAHLTGQGVDLGAQRRVAGLGGGGHQRRQPVGQRRVPGGLVVAARGGETGSERFGGCGAGVVQEYLFQTHHQELCRVYGLLGAHRGGGERGQASHAEQVTPSHQLTVLPQRVCRQTIGGRVRTGGRRARRVGQPEHPGWNVERLGQPAQHHHVGGRPPAGFQARQGGRRIADPLAGDFQGQSGGGAGQAQQGTVPAVRRGVDGRRQPCPVRDAIPVHDHPMCMFRSV